MAVNGNQVVLAVKMPDDSIVKLGGQRDANFDRTGDAIDTSDKDTGHNTNIPGQRGSTFSLDKFWTPSEAAYERLVQAWENGEQVTVRRREYGSDVKEALCTITNVSENAPFNGAIQCSVTGQVSGKFEPVV